MMMASIPIVSGAFTILVAWVGIKLIGIVLFLQVSFIYGFFPAGLIAISRTFELNVRGIATGFIIGCGVITSWGVTPFLLGPSGDLLSFKFGLLMLGIAAILSSGLVFLLRSLSTVHYPTPASMTKKGAWLEVNKGGSLLRIDATAGCLLNSLSRNCLINGLLHPFG
jgi:hypothetical protein